MKIKKHKKGGIGLGLKGAACGRYYDNKTNKIIKEQTCMIGLNCRNEATGKCASKEARESPNGALDPSKRYSCQPRYSDWSQTSSRDGGSCDSIFKGGSKKKSSKRKTKKHDRRKKGGMNFGGIGSPCKRYYKDGKIVKEGLCIPGYHCRNEITGECVVNMLKRMWKPDGTKKYRGAYTSIDDHSWGDSSCQPRYKDWPGKQNPSANLTAVERRDGGECDGLQPIWYGDKLGGRKTKRRRHQDKKRFTRRKKKFI